MLPPALFARGQFSGAVAVGALLNTGFHGLLAPLYFPRVHGYGTVRAGFALLPAVGLVALGSGPAGRVTARTGPRLPVVVGLLVGAAGLACRTLAGPGTPCPALVAPPAAAGFGTSFTMPAATAAALEAAPAALGGASAVLNAARQTGSAVGVAVFGTLIARDTPAHAPGVRAAAAVGACAFLLGAALAARLLAGRGERRAAPRPRRPG
ncbi:MFS transporter [Streptomyces hoynatensis]|uniref:MFS transporter n=1 Tax=Streptomyces hoynatensis TaxID=1141874 RepID=A0A3A9YZW9_9ACTN|nr:MFS transporter [Streptomyces hoynatensis]RKN41244.1 hypothetical protein D7294_16080 [Streptomyces hoynatensis]